MFPKVSFGANSDNCSSYASIFFTFGCFDWMMTWFFYKFVLLNSCNSFPELATSVSYTHLRAHETSTSLCFWTLATLFQSLLLLVQCFWTLEHDFLTLMFLVCSSEYCRLLCLRSSIMWCIFWWSLTTCSFWYVPLY